MKQLSWIEEASACGCGDCLCRECMLWWSNRCPYGECYDDRRAKENPYDAAHPNKPPRTGWTNWRTDQAFWCRGGICYPQHVCEHYVHYKGSKVKSCLMANVQIFQDGYISCSLVDRVGCEACYRMFEEQAQEKERKA